LCRDGSVHVGSRATEDIHCAIPAAKLTDGMSLSVADALAERGIPFLVASGCDKLDPGYDRAPVLRKVFTPKEVIEAVADILRPQLEGQARNRGGHFAAGGSSFRCKHRHIGLSQAVRFASYLRHSDSMAE
jgi:hypothetical protein